MENDYSTVGKGTGKTTIPGCMGMGGLCAESQNPALILTEAAAQVGVLSQTDFQVRDCHARWRVV